MLSRWHNDELIVFSFRGRCVLLLASVGFPGLRDHVGVDGVGVLHGHLRMRERELWWVGKAGHALVPVRAAQDNSIPIFVNVGGHVAESGNCAVEYPGAAAVRIR